MLIFLYTQHTHECTGDHLLHIATCSVIMVLEELSERGREVSSAIISEHMRREVPVINSEQTRDISVRMREVCAGHTRRDSGSECVRS